MGHIITIDGPSGAGKTTVAHLVASELRLPYIPSGALYRAAAVVALRQNLVLEDAKAITNLADHLDITLTTDGKVFYRGDDISSHLQDPEVSLASTIIAVNPKLRERLTKLQRQFGEKGCVIEGRSTAVEIFPDAKLKVWLTASTEERIRRKDVNGHSVKVRDTLDTIRERAPMEMAKDAITIDSTHLSTEAIVKQIVAEYRRR